LLPKPLCSAARRRRRRRRQWTPMLNRLLFPGHQSLDSPSARHSYSTPGHVLSVLFKPFSFTFAIYLSHITNPTSWPTRKKSARRVTFPAMNPPHPCCPLSIRPRRSPRQLQPASILLSILRESRHSASHGTFDNTNVRIAGLGSHSAPA